MKKFTLSFMSLLMVLCLLAGCGVATANVNLTDVMTKISTDVTLPEMTAITDIAQLKTKYGIEEKDVKQFVVKINATGVDQDEIIMIEATSGDSAKTVAAQLQKRLDSKASQAKDYLPDQYEFISKSKVNTDGNYVSMFVSAQQDKMLEIYSSFFK